MNLEVSDIPESQKHIFGIIIVCECPRWSSGKISVSEPEGSRFETDSSEDLPCFWAWCTLNLTLVERPLVRVLERKRPAQVPYFSSALGSRLQFKGPSQNRPRVAAKKGVNVARLRNLLRSHKINGFPHLFSFSCYVNPPLSSLGGGFFGTYLLILNFGQINRTALKFAPLYPKFYTTRT
ncbi:hypothetical protein AVEN_48464-1 [Araneus ventricosus]|uniref:Uncharacterized protein n=1 Tax=Araneus ventricosus TaxID=182803 RepID=A0A4Y2UEY0_ARAVE|nr:hypothetical protein AVEN_236306-1 [Araneus ventricosus]GBO11106.1 hypothetical protein AVEN_48464-1 [Araneus ventricosus]